VGATDTYGLYNTGMWDDTSYGCKIQQTSISGGYSYSVASDWANRPVNYVSYWDSCRFANWLGNRQLTGAQNASTTERGAYTLDGYNGPLGGSIQRNAGATWAVTSEDEWYKAAYYKGGGTTAGYWDYPTKSNTAPANQVLATDPGNSANYYISTMSAAFSANSGSVEIHQLRRRARQIPCLRNTRHTYDAVTSPRASATSGPFQPAYPDGDGSSSLARMRLSIASPYFTGLPERARSERPATPAPANRPRHFETV